MTSLSSLVVKFNTFAINCVSGSFLPYTATYCAHYGNATMGQVGDLKLISNFVGIPVLFAIGSYSDRYAWHKQLYILSLIIALICYGSLLLPIFYSSGHTVQISSLLGPWYYLIAPCIIICSIAITLQLNMSDAFCANTADRIGSTYGNFRVWGGLGLVIINLLLYVIDSFSNQWQQPILPQLILITSSLAILIYTISLWPDTSAFKIAAPAQQETIIEQPNQQAQRPIIDGTVCTRDDNNHYVMRRNSNWKGEEQLTIVTTFAKKSESDQRDEQGRSVSLASIGADARGTEDKINFRLHMRILLMLMGRNKLIVRFFIIYFICGFVQCLNNMFFVSFLKRLDEDSISKAPLILTFAYLSETCAYFYSHHITNRLSFSSSLNLVLGAFTLRYSLYLIFLADIERQISLYWLIPIEMLQALTTALFSCVFSVAAIKFSQESGDLLPELSRLSHIDDCSPESICKISEGFKMTMMSLSSCCYDGFGMGLGSKIGGIVIDKYDYGILWTATSIFTFLCMIMNISIDKYEHYVTSKKQTPVEPVAFRLSI